MKTSDTSTIRIDKYLWAIRVYKTRSQAGIACEKGKVKLKENPVKASHHVKQGEIYTIKIDADYSRIIEVKMMLEKRQSFTVAQNYFIEHSPPRPKKEKGLAAFILPQGKREKGSGRPTKKDRRNLKKGGFL